MALGDKGIQELVALSGRLSAASDTAWRPHRMTKLFVATTNRARCARSNDILSGAGLDLVSLDEFRGSSSPRKTETFAETRLKALCTRRRPACRA
jgi:hypothetical protein